ncbi:MAG: class I SAM-dependent methyltransferase [Halobacteriota archaeon]
MVSNHPADTAIEPRIAEHDDNLELYLNQIGTIFDIPRLISEPQRESQTVNDDAVPKFQSLFFFMSGGFYHCGISYDGRHKNEDFKEQAKIVERYVHDSNAKHVLELGSGWGGNSAFLAKRNPEVTCEGVDLSPNTLKRFAKIPNAHFYIGDFHDLSAFKDDTYDVVFVIDSLLYSTNKLQVLREVKKKLKRGGLFIMFEWYRRDRAIPLSPSEEIMCKLMEVSWAAKLECIKDVEGYVREGYSIAAANDLTQYALPSTVAIDRRIIRYYFAHPMFARITDKFLSPDLAKGWIASYLHPTSIKRWILCYYVHVLKNDE